MLSTNKMYTVCLIIIILGLTTFIKEQYKDTSKID